MRIFGSIVTTLGVIVCLLALAVAANAPWGENAGLVVIGVALAGVGVIFGGAILLRNSN